MLISLQELKHPDQLDLLACAARAEGFHIVDRLQLRTHTPEADAFYRSLGFRREEGDPDCTHLREIAD